MGVLNCDRKGCENIMCDRYSHTYGYLCWSCFQELCQSGLEVEDFMETEIGSTTKATITVEEYYQEFPMQEKQ